MTIQPGGPRFEGDSQPLIATLLLFVAKGDGTISGMETDKMLALLEQHMGLRSAEALALLTDAMAGLADDPDLGKMVGHDRNFSDTDKEDIVFMLLNVIAADGRQDAEEMDKLGAAADIIGVSPEIMHKAYDKYFEATSW
jgi:uncharacterized tellurite resistance protein B-like protein